MGMVPRRLPLVLLALLTACTASSPHPPDRGTPRSSPVLTAVSARPARCPADAQARLQHNAVGGTRHALVPGTTPTVLVLCGVGPRVVVRGWRVVRLVRQLNGLKHVPNGVAFACPLDMGPTFALYFDYANGDVLLVTVDASGCRFAANGRLSSWADDHVLGRLRHLLTAA
jgi:hypothetical protein